MAGVPWGQESLHPLSVCDQAALTLPGHWSHICPSVEAEYSGISTLDPADSAPAPGWLCLSGHMEQSKDCGRGLMLPRVSRRCSPGLLPWPSSSLSWDQLVCFSAAKG